MAAGTLPAPTDAVLIEPALLVRYAAEILCGLGARDADAARVAESLVAANLAGHDSHGVLLLPYYAELITRGQIRLDAETAVLLDHGAVTVLDGRFGFGQVAGAMATTLAIARGREHGVACVLARNVNHVARLGEYTSAVADAGLAALLLVNCQGSGQLLAPFGGIERRLTNNPISIAAPGDTHPLLLDMALSVAAEAKVWLAKARGETLPPGWILDGEGRESTDPDDLFAGGTLLPVGGPAGGHKGYGLIVLVDVLAGILSGGGVCRPDSPADFSNAFLLIALDVGALASRDHYLSELRVLRDHVTSSRRADGVKEILLPGDVEAASARRRAEGIPIERSTWQALADLARQVGVEPAD